MTHHCGRCPTDNPTPARYHFTAHGYGSPVDVYVCDTCLPATQQAAAKHPHRTTEFLVDDGQDTLFDLGSEL